MKKNYKVNDDLTLEMDGRMYRLTKNKLNNCGHCPFHKIQGCGELCQAAYFKAAEIPSFDYCDAIFVEVTENKETAMKEKEPKNEPNYKALYEQEHKKYGDAVERMKSWMNGEHPECFSEAQKAAEFVFPELVESEDKKMINFITIELMGLRALESNGGGKGSDRYEELTNGIAWLEKQEERTTNKNDFDRGYDAGISAAKFNQWRPTEEQMSYLASAIEQCDFCDPEHAALEVIYTHFKKL